MNRNPTANQRPPARLGRQGRFFLAQQGSGAPWKGADSDVRPSPFIRCSRGEKPIPVGMANIGNVLCSPRFS